MIDQLNSLFNAMISGNYVDTTSPLVRTGIAVIQRQPDIFANQIPLSSFNVLLSERHGLGCTPVVGFPAMSKDTDTQQKIDQVQRIGVMVFLHQPT